MCLSLTIAHQSIRHYALHMLPADNIMLDGVTATTVQGELHVSEDYRIHVCLALPSHMPHLEVIPNHILNQGILPVA